MQGSVNNQVRNLWYIVDGIGQSKAFNRAKSEYIGHNGHKVSEKVHAYLSKDEFIRLAKELETFAKVNFQIRDMQTISQEVVHMFISNKIEDGLYQNTLSTYISMLAKIQLALSKLPKKLEKHNSHYTQADLKDLREIINTQSVKAKHTNRAYRCPQSFMSEISVQSKIGFQLQLYYGLRVREAILIRPKQLLSDNMLEIQGKGGYIRYIKLPPNLYSLIEQEIRKNGSYFQKYNLYIEDLQNAVKATNEKWTGTHGLRYNYAQTKMNEYQKIMDYDKALARVSFELGHHRTEITQHYLK